MEQDRLYAMRHSLAHIMAAAVKRLWPEAKLGVGPVVENGFYYDIDLGEKKISEEDFKKIEDQMRKIVSEDQPFEQFDKSIDEAIEWARGEKQSYKEELLNDLKRAGTTSAKDIDASQLGVPSDAAQVNTVSFYKNGDFTDLCRGPHVESTGEVRAFKLTKVAGAFWRGNDTKPQMQRLYGVGFETARELDEYLKNLAEASLRDHRLLGKQLDLFVFSDLVGSGLPLFTPRGTVIRDLLNLFSQQLRLKRGFQKVWIPHITKTDLYKKSGHWEKFGDELFLVKSQETSDEFVLKPMNCPHHIQIYASRPRSYRDLPIKYLETTTIYRDEKSGELHGLSRVRSATQDDSHAFAREDQIEQAALELIDAAKEFNQALDMKLRFRLSFRDEGDQFLGDRDLWDRAQAILKSLVEKEQLNYFIAEGEAAFYGPKVDFIVTDALGREWQLATVQLDFVMPERFGLSYTDQDGSSKRPVIIHVALLGSIERFLSVYIEHTAGHFPFWLSPEQVRLLMVNETVEAYAKELEDELTGFELEQPVEHNRLRFTVDRRNESLGKKIREAEVDKVPIILIVGPKDRDAHQVSVRTKDGEKTIARDQLVDFLRER